MNTSKAIVGTVAVALASSLCCCTNHTDYKYNIGSVWGTTYHITYKSDTDMADSILSVMNAIDMSLSPFQKGSLISAVNSGETVKADDMMCYVLEMSKDVNRISGGMFDPTVATLINLWGFGYEEGAADRPNQCQIDSALMSVGIQECFIDSAGYVVRKSPDTKFNFSAIAKGYGIDCIAAMLRRNGVTDYMVEVGGEIALSGESPSGEPWRIQVDAPVVDPVGQLSHNALQILQMTDRCVATSGNYRNYRSTSEGNAGHTISPVTGMPVVTSTLSATVIAPNTALADALATSAMAMPDSAAIAMIEALPEVKALLVKASDDGSYQLLYLNGFEDLIVN